MPLNVTLATSAMIMVIGQIRHPAKAEAATFYFRFFHGLIRFAAVMGGSSAAAVFIFYAI